MTETAALRLPDPCALVNPRSMPEALKGLAYEDFYIPQGEVWIFSGGKSYRFRIESEGS